MSAMAVPSSSSLNPNAPLFIPAAYRQVEDFSPQWWDLVHTTAWFRDHVFRQQYQHQQLQEEMQAPQQHHDADAALPDDDDLFYAPDHHLFSQYQEEPSSGGADEMLRTLNLASWEPQHQPSIRHADKLPAAQQQHVGITANARRFIHQAR